MICHYYTEPLFLFYVPELSGILYYSHIPAIIIAFVTGLFILANDRKALPNRLLFAICTFFSGWTLLSLISWTNINSGFLLFSWSMFGVLSALISIFSIYFAHAFLEKKDLSVRTKAVLAALLAPVIVLAPTALNLTGFNISDCDAFGFENTWYELYYTSLGVIAMAWIAVLLLRSYKKALPGFRRQVVLMGTGLLLFLFSFYSTGYLASYLTSIGFLPDSELEMFGYFGIIVFVIYIGILVVRFKAFHAGLLAAQALLIALIALVGSQYTFVSNMTARGLVTVTLVLTLIAGVILIRSVRREIAQRKHIEELAGELEKANKQQIILIHFITHQIKGFLTKSRNIFAMAMEGDLGAVPETMKPMLEEGFKSDTKGVNTIQEILNAANIKSGKVTYTMSDIDLKKLIEEIAEDLRPGAEAKGLQLTFACDTESLIVKGDRVQLVNAFKNLIDNSIKYTLKGSVNVSLTKDEDTVRFKVEDTGVGITEEDMAKLFTEGGHGTNSTKVNVESTGFGLYIVKNIIEAHHGKVWAESEGEGKGSRFIAELPA
ncbi:MAG TPA: ATP-binding protein [Candidatus Paceibacterota bacterium]|nr:ATP-binding protein [Candidatus Paceibacterota bacterium]